MYCKTLSLIFLTLLAKNTCAQNEFANNRERLKRNHVSEVITYTISSTKLDSTISTHEIYNRDGNLIKDQRFNEQGKVNFTFKIKYDSKGLMLKQLGYNGLNKNTTILKFEYDNRGNMIDYKQLKPDGTILINQKRTYDELNQNTLLYNQDRNKGDFFVASKFFYNSDKKYDKIENYNETGKLVSTSEYVYNDTLNMLIVYNVIEGLRNISSIHVYDVNGNLTKRTIPLMDTNVTDPNLLNKHYTRHEEYKYDSNDNLIEVTYFKQGSLSTSEKIYYKYFN